MINGAPKLLALLMTLVALAPHSAIASDKQPQNASDQDKNTVISVPKPITPAKAEINKIIKIDPRASRKGNSEDKNIFYSIVPEHLTDEDLKLINKNARINHTYDYNHLDELKKYEYLNMGNEAKVTNKEKLKKEKKSRANSLEKSLGKSRKGGNNFQSSSPLEFSTTIFGN